MLRYVSENSGVCQDTSIILTVFGQQDVEQYNFEELLVPIKCTGLNFMKGNFVTVYLKNIIKSTCHYYELLFKLLSKIQCSKFIQSSFGHKYCGKERLSLIYKIITNSSSYEADDDKFMLFKAI